MSTFKLHHTPTSHTHGQTFWQTSLLLGLLRFGVDSVTAFRLTENPLSVRLYCKER